MTDSLLLTQLKSMLDGMAPVIKAAGTTGPAGPAGTDGYSVLSGAGVPDTSLGVNDDFYINTTAHTIYGPKTAGTWGSPTSMVGPTGATGPTGPEGSTSLSLFGDIIASGTLGGLPISTALATVNSNTGSFGDGTHIPYFTVNAKGLVTAAGQTAISFPSGTLAFTGDVTGTGSTGGSTALTLATVNGNTGTYNSVTVNGKGLVTAASNTAYLTSNQSVTLSGDVSGSGSTAIAVTLATVPISKGGTGQTTATTGFNALAPSQTGNNGKFLTSDGTTASWANVSVSAGSVSGLGGAALLNVGTTAGTVAAGDDTRLSGTHIYRYTTFGGF